jgi:hypothetical protein
MLDPHRVPDRTRPGVARFSLFARAEPTSREPLPVPDVELRRAIDALDAAAIRWAAGALLEHIADRLGWTRGMSIARRRGDGSLADRWPSVVHALRKTDADDLAEQVTRSPVFRQLAAEQDADRVSRAETTRFGNSVLGLLDQTRCASCGQWWSASPGTSRWTCRCRSLVVDVRPNTR